MHKLLFGVKIGDCKEATLVLRTKNFSTEKVQKIRDSNKKRLDKKPQ